MNLAIISDIHSNYDALKGVLDAIKEYKCEKLCVLGDVIGFGPEPRKCVERLRRENSLNVLGNNEFFLMNRVTDGEEESIRRGVEYARKKLSDECISWIGVWEMVKQIPDKEVLLFHGNLVKGQEFNRLLFLEDVLTVFEIILKEYSGTKVAFFGNTQEEMFYSYDLKTHVVAVEKIKEEWNFLESGKIYLINPGSVGRFGSSSNRGSAVVYDKDKNRVKWVYRDYNVNRVIKKMAMIGESVELSKKMYRGY